MKTYDQVLNLFLKQSDTTHNGSSMAEQLGVSRNAIWKAVQQLRQDGFQIESISGKGYFLKEKPKSLNAHQITFENQSSWSDLVVVIEEQVTSTNDLAKKFATEHPNTAALFIAREQTHGRGRYGKSFYSSLNQGLYFSLVVPPALIQGDPAQLTLIAAVALVTALEMYTNESVQIKWVNDIFYKGKKIAGILSEASFNIESNELSAVIIGVGLNLAGDLNAVERDLEKVMGTFFGDHLPADFSFNDFLTHWLTAFKNNLMLLPQKDYLIQYQSHMLGLGQAILYVEDKIEQEGRIQGIDQNGHLIVEKDGGQIKYLSSGNVQIGSQQFI